MYLPWAPLASQMVHGKESVCQCRRHKRGQFTPWVRKIPWSSKWQPTPVFLPEESHGQRSLTGYSPWRSQRLRCEWTQHKHSNEVDLHSWPCCLRFLPLPSKSASQPAGLKRMRDMWSRPGPNPQATPPVSQPAQIYVSIAGIHWESCGCALATRVNDTRPKSQHHRLPFFRVRRTKTCLLCLVKEHYLSVFSKSIVAKTILK